MAPLKTMQTFSLNQMYLDTLLLMKNAENVTFCLIKKNYPGLPDIAGEDSMRF